MAEWEYVERKEINISRLLAILPVDEEGLLAKGIYGKYSYTFQVRSPGGFARSDVLLPLEYAVTGIITAEDEEDVDSLLEFLDRPHSMSLSHPNILKVHSPIQRFDGSSLHDSRPKRFEQILPLFCKEFEEEQRNSLNSRLLPYTLYGIEYIQIVTGLHGGTLKQLLQGRGDDEPGPPPATQLEMLHGMLEGMKFLESRGVRHGHLHAKNVLLNQFACVPVKIGFLQEVPKNYHYQGDMNALGVLFYLVLELPQDIEFPALLWHIAKPPLRNRMIKDVDSLVGKMLESEEALKFQYFQEIRIELNPNFPGKKELDEIQDVVNQLRNPDGSVWVENTSLLEDRLGEGAFGFVTTAKNERSGQVTAVKVFKKAAAAEIEYNTIKFQFHRNLVRTHQLMEKILKVEQLKSLQADHEPSSDSCASPIGIHIGAGSVKVLCTEMELCGPTLSQWLKSGRERRDGPTQLLVLTDILCGLEFLHSREIIHRDLKPNNILFSPGEAFPVKIGDFGLSRLLPESAELEAGAGSELDGESRPGSLTRGIGNSLYRAPEVETGSYGKPADLYSFGLIMWEILCDLPESEGGSRRKWFLRLKRRKGDYAGAVEESQANSFIANGKELILALTEPEVRDRIQCTKQVRLRGVTSRVYQPSDMLELKRFVEFGGSGSRIELGRVSCHPILPHIRNDILGIECDFGVDKLDGHPGSGFSLDDCCVIRDTDPADLEKYKKLARDNRLEFTPVEPGIIYIYLYEQFVDHVRDIYRERVKLQVKLEFTGVSYLSGTMVNLAEGLVGLEDRNVGVVVEADEWIFSTLGPEGKTHSLSSNPLRDALSHTGPSRIQGVGYLLLN